MMLRLTRRDGTTFWLNPYLVEMVEAMPDTVVVLSNGHRFLVRESAHAVRRAWLRCIAEGGMGTPLFRVLGGDSEDGAGGMEGA